MELLTRAANILDTSEYEVLRRAYRAWHGHPAPETELQRAFRLSLRRNELPPWARAYTLQVVQRFEADYRRRQYRRRLARMLLFGAFPRFRRRNRGGWPA